MWWQKTAETAAKNVNKEAKKLGLTPNEEKKMEKAVVKAVDRAKIAEAGSVGVTASPCVIVCCDSSRHHPRMCAHVCVCVTNQAQDHA